MIKMENISPEDYVTIPRREYEELIRDSERLRSIGIMSENSEYSLEKNQILAMCGFEKGIERDK